MGLATFTDVVAAFTITYSLPYVMAAAPFVGPTKTSNVGWIFGGISFCSFIFVTFFVPELAGRSLEEVDELFVGVSPEPPFAIQANNQEQKLWAWQFKGYKTTGIGAHIAQLERGDAAGAQGVQEAGLDGLEKGSASVERDDKLDMGALGDGQTAVTRTIVSKVER
jgi:hypothetical protein